MRIKKLLIVGTFSISHQLDAYLHILMQQHQTTQQNHRLTHQKIQQKLKLTLKVQLKQKKMLMKITKKDVKSEKNDLKIMNPLKQKKQLMIQKMKM